MKHREILELRKKIETDQILVEKNLEALKRYLTRMESNRVKDEHLNKTSYSHARELSAVVSLYEHGNKDAKKIAARILRRR